MGESPSQRRILRRARRAEARRRPDDRICLSSSLPTSSDYVPLHVRIHNGAIDGDLEPSGAFAPGWRGRVVRWAPPSIAALLIAGPVLRPGSVFNLDLVLPPRLDVPAGLWGLGPELPRRLPLWTYVSIGSRIVTADAIGKALMVACLIGAWIGMARLLRGLGPYAGHVAGALYALSPFILTRTAVGHFMVTVPYAVLPWVLPVMLRPGQRPLRTFAAASALAIGGHFGGSLAMVVLIVAAVVGDRRRWWRGLLATVCAQMVWLIPGLLIWWSGASNPAGGIAFRTIATGPLGFGRLSAGGGFWNAYFQAGGSGVLEAVAGAVLLALAIAGSRDLPAPLRRPLIVLGGFGWFAAASSAIPGVRDVVDALTENPLGGIWREGQRLLGLHLIWLAPAAVLGARRLGGSSRFPGFVAGIVRAAPVAVALVLVTPSVWGIGGQLEATPIPPSWMVVRSAVRSEPGTVLALPWFQYFNLQIGEGRTHRVLNPLPLFLGGDVLSSSNNGLGRGVRERADPREVTAEGLVRRIEAGDPAAGDLADVGVRWIVVLKASDRHIYAGLWNDPGLKKVEESDSIALFRVSGWVGPGLLADGRAVSVDPAVPSVVSPDTDEAFTWFRVGSKGWRRGGRSVPVDERGLLVVPAVSGAVWNVLVIPCVLSQFVPFGAIPVWWYRRRQRARALPFVVV